MSSANEARQATMDATQVYREETFTDRKVGTIRRLMPVTADGGVDTTRPVLFVGQAQVMTPMGAVPISFELEASPIRQTFSATCGLESCAMHGAGGPTAGEYCAS